MLKIDVSCYIHSSLRGVFRTLLSIYDGNLFAKMINKFKSINLFSKSSAHMPMFLVTEFLHSFHKTICTRSAKIQFLILISTNLYWDARGLLFLQRSLNVTIPTQTLQLPQIFVKVDLLPIDNYSEKKKIARKIQSTSNSSKTTGNVKLSLIEAIRTISSLFIFFIKRFRAHKNTLHLEVYTRVKNCCLYCLVLASFCFVSWFSLVTCFCPREIFF